MDKRLELSNIIHKHKIDQSDLMNIFLSYGIDYSTNSNGIFINLSLIDDKTITDIFDKIVLLIDIDTSNTSENKSPKKDIRKPIKREIIRDIIQLSSIDKELIKLSKQILTI
tara:strand:- start:361 stop:696 length:336 start_codon:yes stop_codon:yes gene_type:complete